MCIKEYSIDETYRVVASSGSKGCQLKYFKDNHWFKINSNGYEGLSEEVVYKILHCSNYSNYVKYSRCKVNGRPGCVSKNFLKPGELLISFASLFFSYTGKNLGDVILTMESLDDRIDFVVEFFNKTISVDVSSYLSTVFCVDLITRNCDRHFDNLAFIKNDGVFRCAPIFDNGDSFFSDYSKFDPWMNVEECIEKSFAKPFSGSFNKQFEHFPNKFRINYSELFKYL
jgi:hypothetical protein